MTSAPTSAVARRYLPLLGLLLLAAALRFWALDHSLPFVMGRPDEVEALEKTIEFPKGDFNPRWFVYPNLFFWVIWLWEELCLGLRGLVATVPPYDVLVHEQMAVLVAQGRVLSALVGTATVGLVWWIGRRLDGPRVAFLAAFLLATNFLHVRDSHALKADVQLTFSVPIALWLLARYVDEPTRRRAWWAAIWIGVATALKYPGVLLLAPALHATVLASPQRGWRRWLPSRTAFEMIALAALTFLALSPYLLIDTTRLMATFTFSVKAVYGVRPQFAPKPGDGVFHAVAMYLWTRTYWYHIATSLRHGSGLLVALATPCALFFALGRRQAAFWRLSAGFTVLYYAVISSSQVGLARYLTPLMPVLALLIAHALDRAVEWSVRRERQAVVLAVLTALLVAEPVCSIVAHNRIAARADTRVEATQWMADHIPAGSVVARLGSLFFPIADPALPPSLRAAALPLGETDLDRYGVQWIVVHEHQLPFSHPIPDQLRILAPRMTLQADFSPFVDEPSGEYEFDDAYYIPFWNFGGVMRPGPRVRIYRWEPAR